MFMALAPALEGRLPAETKLHRVTLKFSLIARWIARALLLPERDQLVFCLGDLIGCGYLYLCLAGIGLTSQHCFLTHITVVQQSYQLIHSVRQVYHCHGRGRHKACHRIRPLIATQITTRFAVVLRPSTWSSGKSPQYDQSSSTAASTAATERQRTVYCHVATRGGPSKPFQAGDRRYPRIFLSKLPGPAWCLAEGPFQHARPQVKAYTFFRM